MTSWHEMTDPEKFRLYTRISLQGAAAVAVIVLAITGGGFWPAAGIVISGLVAVVAVEAQPALAAWPSATFRRWALPGAAIVLTAVWVTYAIVANVADDDALVDGARVAGSAAATLGLLSIVAFTRRTWWSLGLVSVATGLAFGISSGRVPQLTVATLVVGSIVIGTTLLSLWGLRIVEDLERSKDLGANLQLAEERLRFARDLHDVVGRSFSAIAVKSELAVTLSRAGATERAAAEMDEVKTLAVDSMAEMRQLVRGYRDIDLQGEVAGARSLLSSAGCDLAVEGHPDKVPQQFHELAAWVVREGTTNIVKHSSARTATLAFGSAGMSLRNDGASGAPRERSGLRGLAERLAAGGATLDTLAAGDEFVLEIHWESA